MATKIPERFEPAYERGPFIGKLPKRSPSKFVAALQNEFKDTLAGAFDFSGKPESTAWHKPQELSQALEALFGGLRKLLPADSSPELETATKSVVESACDIAILSSMFNYDVGHTAAMDAIQGQFDKRNILTKEEFEMHVQGIRAHLPNKKYTDEMFKFFKHQCVDLQLSQEDAFTATQAEFPIITNKEGFIRSYRTKAKHLR